MGRWVGRYCPDCDDVVETCACIEEREARKRKERGPAVRVAFQPQYYHAIGEYAGSKRELYEKAARKGIKLAVEQIP